MAEGSSCMIISFLSVQASHDGLRAGGVTCSIDVPEVVSGAVSRSAIDFDVVRTEFMYMPPRTESLLRAKLAARFMRNSYFEKVALTMHTLIVQVDANCPKALTGAGYRATLRVNLNVYTHAVFVDHLPA